MTVTLEEVVGFKLSDFDQLYCDFSSIERTKLTMVNATHGNCLTPYTLFTQSVNLRVISTDIEHTIITNHDTYYEFIADFEFHRLEPEIIMLHKDGS